MRADHSEVIYNHEDFRFCMKMIDGRLLHTTSSSSEGCVMDLLQLLDGGGAGVRETDRGCK